MDELAPYMLQDVQGGGKDATDLESGAYGVVFQVTVNGLPCMAKRLHAILVKGIAKENHSNIEKRFRDECLLLSQLHHPNIVRFIGVCYLESKTDLTLVMEKLHMDVAYFVRRYANIPLPIKTSIAADVSYGLLYLHNRTPPIVHRDLTAPNVLLTIDRRAKIADLGVSKVLNNPLSITKTTAPGNVNYMAPETKVENPNYGTSMDVFSFGHLLLHLALQDWPPVYESGDHQALQGGLMEVAKRKKALETMGEKHPFHPLTVECLHDNPSKRPKTQEVNQRLANLCTHQYPKSFADILDVTDEEEKSHLNGESVQQSRAVEERHAQEKQELRQQIDSLREELETSGTEKASLMDQYSSLVDRHKGTEVQVTTLEDEKQALTKECDKVKTANHKLRLEMKSDQDRLEKTIKDTSHLSDEVLVMTQKLKLKQKTADTLTTKLSEREDELRVREKELEESRELVKAREEENQGTIAGLVEDNRVLDQERHGLAEELDKVMFDSRDKITAALEELQQQFTSLRQKHGAEQRAGNAQDHKAHNLPGVEVIRQTTLIITNSAQSFKWEDYGLEINVPPNSLPPEIAHCVLHIYASLSGQYKLPDNHHLVSAVYWVRPVPYCQFAQPLTLQIQHCARREFLKSLSFFRAVCTQETLPYTFTKLEGKGVFSQESSYGSLRVDQFSGFVVGAEGEVERMYSAGLYYLGRDVRSWEIHLVVSWDSEAHNKVIRRYYKRREAVSGPVMSIEFEGEDLKLDVPMEGLEVRDWTIRPLVRPQLARRRVDYFKPGRTIPHCQLTAKYLKEGPAANELHHLLTLGGAREPNNVIAIEIDPKVARRPRYSLRGAPPPHDDTVTLDQLMIHTGVTDRDLTQQTTEEALSLIAPHISNWRSYATALQLTDPETQQINTDGNLNVHMKAVLVLKQWRRRCGFRATYKRLVEVCLRLNDAVLAEEVCRVILRQGK